jgi:hypothetical protein
MTEAKTRRLWVAYGPAGAVGKIQKDDDAYVVQMAGADDPLGSYPTMEIARSALQAHLKPGAERPEYREH